MKTAWLMLVVMVVLVFPSGAFAAPALDPYTSEHYWILPHTKPAWFEGDGSGGFVGETIDGTSFSHRVVENMLNIRLHQFTIGAVSYYLTDRGMIEADSTLAAISIYLSRT